MQDQNANAVAASGEPVNANEAQENALRGISATLSTFILTLKPIVPRAASLVEQAVEDINARWKKEDNKDSAA